jgi:hypothetical protein
LSFFDLYGPLRIERTDGRIMANQAKLWAEADRQADSALSGAIGCYLFCIKYGKKITPWYVGMTVSKKGFRGETFEPHKLGIYNDVMKGRKGYPVLFLFPLHTQTDRFSAARSSGKKLIRWLERTLMGMAFSQNPEISNVRDMQFLKNVEVLGLLGRRPGRPFTEARTIRKVLLGR